MCSVTYKHRYIQPLFLTGKEYHYLFIEFIIFKVFKFKAKPKKSPYIFVFSIFYNSNYN